MPIVLTYSVMRTITLNLYLIIIEYTSSSSPVTQVRHRLGYSMQFRGPVTEYLKKEHHIFTSRAGCFAHHGDVVQNPLGNVNVHEAITVIVTNVRSHAGKHAAVRLLQ